MTQQTEPTTVLSPQEVEDMAYKLLKSGRMPTFQRFSDSMSMITPPSNLLRTEKSLPIDTLLTLDKSQWFIVTAEHYVPFEWRRKPLVKAGAELKSKYFTPEDVKAKGMRWVTIRGARVLLQGTKDGYVVVGGAGGKLNHFKVDKILDPGDYKRRTKERLQAQKEDKNQEVERLRDSGKFEEYETARRKRDTENLVERKRLKQVKQKRTEIKREYMTELMDIAHAKTINEFIGENRVKEIEERVIEQFKGDFKAKLDKDKADGKDAKDVDVESYFDSERIKRSVMKKTDELKRREATRVVKDMENQAMQTLSKEFFNEHPDVVTKVVDEELETKMMPKIEDAMEIMKAKKRMKEMVKEAKKSVFLTGALKVGEAYAGALTDAELSESVSRDVKDAIETAHNIQFYDEINPHIDRIAKYIDSGAARAMNGAMASLYEKGSFFNEDLVRELGVEPISRAIAQKIHDDGKADVALKALKGFSADMRQKVVKDAMKQANNSYANRDMILGGAEGEDPMYTKAQGRAMAIRHTAQAYNQLGSAAGSLRAMAHMINALEDPPNKLLSVDLGTGEDHAKRKMERTGLNLGEYKLRKGVDRHWHAEIKSDTLAPFFEKNQQDREHDDHLDSIKRHEMNTGEQAPGMTSKWGFNPSTKKFESEIAQSQEAGYRFAKEQDRTLLDFSAGIGKTYISANLLSDAVKRGDRKILVVVPANLKEQTSEDGYKKFLPEGMRDLVQWSKPSMSPDKRKAMYAEMGIHVVSHNALENDAEFLQGQDWDYVVADEVHQLINSKEGEAVGLNPSESQSGGVTGSKSYHSLKKISDKAKRMTVMTGTPVKTNKNEIYKIAHLMGESDRLGTMKEFEKRHADVNQTSNAFAASEVDALRKEIAPFTYSQSYQLKVDKNETRKTVKSSGEQRRRNKEIMQQYGSATDAGKIGASGTRDNELWKATHLLGGRDNPKFKAMVSHMKETLGPTGSGLVFFSQGPAREGTETYARQLNEEFGDGTAMHVHSGVSAKKVKEYKLAINGDPAMQKKYPNLRFLVATDSLATGHNITGAKKVYKVDIPRDKAQDNQQSARSYRLGQNEDVEVVYLDGDDPNEVNKRYNFEKKTRESQLTGNPSSVGLKDDSGFGSYLRAAEIEATGGSPDDQEGVKQPAA